MKKSLILLLVLAMVFTLVACGGGTDKPSTAPSGDASNAPEGSETPASEAPANEPVYGGIMKMIGGDASIQWGLPWELSYTALPQHVPVTECPLHERTDGTIEPWLAESWEVDIENLEIRFKMREDVTFSDGSPLNAEVCVWNYTKSLEQGTMNPAVESFEETGEYTWTAHLKYFLNSVLSIFASHTFCLVSQENYDKNGEDYAREHPVGTGPFIMTEQVSGEKCVYARNDNYWQEGKPYLDGIEIYTITDVMTQKAAFQSTGDDAVDLMTSSNAELISELLQTADVSISQIPVGPWNLIPSSLDEASPLNKLEVRQAVSYALDRDAICEARGYGLIDPATQWIPEGVMGHLDDSYNLSYDPEKAKQLLTDAGYPDGFDVTMYCSTAADKDTMVAIQSMLSEVGINVALEFPESGAFSTLQFNGWDGFLVNPTRVFSTSLTTTFRLAMDPNYQYYPSTWRPAEEMLDPYNTLVSSEVVTEEMGQALHKLIMDNLVMIPVWHYYETYIHRNTIQGGEFAQWGAGTMWLPYNIWINEG